MTSGNSTYQNPIEAGAYSLSLSLYLFFLEN